MQTVLIIDDDREIRDITSMIVEKLGYKAVVAGTAAEAVAMVAQHDPVAAFMDVFMPDKNGLELAMDISQRKKNLPIILMSGRVPVQSDSIKNFTGHFGVVCSVSKPFTPAALKEALNKALGGACTD